MHGDRSCAPSTGGCVRWSGWAEWLWVAHGAVAAVFRVPIGEGVHELVDTLARLMYGWEAE